MKKTVLPWVIALIMLLIGQIGFCLIFSDLSIGIKYLIGLPLEFAITVPAVLWWVENFDKKFDKK